MYDPRSHRLASYDNSQQGLYFITICTRGHVCNLAKVENGLMRLTSAGEIVTAVWSGEPERFPSSSLDGFVVMPNHIHAIVVLGGAGDADPASFKPRLSETTHGPGLGEIIRARKAASTRLIRLARFPEFAWQPNYYERVILSDRALDQMRRYIAGNPSRWEEDELYRA